jgi:hypothetical protein
MATDWAFNAAGAAAVHRPRQTKKTAERDMESLSDGRRILSGCRKTMQAAEKVEGFLATVTSA